MKPIEELFILHRAHSRLFSDYETGKVAYVGNGFSNNAVVGFVTPQPKDKVFKFLGVAISAFCEATVQAPPFIACGRAGNGLVVLEPREPMTAGQLAYIAAYINRALRWRFSWYWQTTVNRLRRLPIPEAPPALAFDVKGALPQLPVVSPPRIRVKLEKVVLGSIYDLVPGDFHSTSELKPGTIPLVSCGDLDNGIIGRVAAPKDRLYEHKLTIALNGRPLTTKYHPYQFVTKDDVAVCLPRTPLQLTSELFIQAMLNRERWRYSYYRKCYIEKLHRFRLNLPVKNGAIDEDAMKVMVEATAYWKYIQSHLPSLDVAA